MKKTIVISVLLCFCISCSKLAITFTKKKQPTFNQGKLAKEADHFFWNNFHQGNYDSIAGIIEKLNLALQENPSDLKTTAHLGFVHIWALSERQRLIAPTASISEHISLSRRYFDEALKMNAHDPRIAGFLADLTLAEGSQFENSKQQTEGYFLGMKAIRMWPQFNKFTIGYIFSSLDSTDKNFKKGLKWQHETIEDCSCQKLGIETDYDKAIEKIKLSQDIKTKRACWNTWIAPHNWEGFCLNWGDMLVKNGEVERAIKIYNLARKSEGFLEWKYKSVLENRIVQAKQNVVNFNKKVDEANLANQEVVMFHSKVACMSCHQMSEKEFSDFGYRELDKSYYFFNEKKK